jgi:glycosyltransferase involved in cell wall biosynthesis
MKVSVLIITYNHEQYIAQALESVLMQEADFDYEVVVGEDCSTDATRSILLDYRSRFGDRLRPLLRDNNIGMHANLIQTLEACKGRYVALLEGDDYWISPEKLSRQADLLDEQPELAMCFHDVKCVFEPGCEIHDPKLTRASKLVFTLDDLLEKNLMHSCSVMFRRGLFRVVPRWYFTLPLGDWPLHILNAQHGNIGYIDAVMGAYRVHPGGVWATRPLTWRVREAVRVLECVEGYLTGSIKNRARFHLARHYLGAAKVHYQSRDLSMALRFTKLGVKMGLVYGLVAGGRWLPRFRRPRPSSPER